MVVFIAGMTGVLVGAVIASIGVALSVTYEQRKSVRYRELENFVKEIETLNLLNKKINEILQKRDIYVDKSVNFISMDDCYISIDDFIYLESFSAQNNFYLPTYLIEEFFKKIAHRKVILTPDEVISMGGSTYKGGRVILESFSEELLSIIEDKKRQMKRLTHKPLYYFQRG
ncbi:hypothetical protein UAW_00473 [Enterococcus haemoperoxidus ATCC BAA-382]|uniref:Uncharacterized protein n=1 Tax=Enterococcus haemoperoxidus ATCC BAA-382 TaxID=1158608 RepID=R2QVB1_9ENTE|nr:hypothetical protein [Enterococcus haemoperoxidus]EOH99323.1 hypothetical protein UAW_00473 [Enterococcus haemoperoxidus ATCC BAA-382]EOT62936.1 hypothetical protein I583_01939 [Enterococcus haemoperoxidus ATCC BAA-382]OJG54706.1 hypothetical protein RV06_GL002665 [Enterococcus haemoperoxidus]